MCADPGAPDGGEGSPSAGAAARAGRALEELDLTPERVRIHPVTLGFGDLDLERRYWVRFTREMRGYLRVVVVLLLLLMLAGAGVDRAVFPRHVTLFWGVRLGLATPFLVLALVFLTAERAQVFLGRWIQEGTLLVAGAMVGTLAVIALVMLPDASVEQLYVASLSWVLVVVAVFGVARLRFLYATPLGAGISTVWLLSLTGRPEFVGARAVTFVFFAFASVLVGMIICYWLELFDRREFVKEALLDVEKRKVEHLLLNVLPRSIAERLKQREGRIADAFDHVSVLFADLVGFTVLSQTCTPAELVDLLDRIFSEFDSLTEEHGLEKIKTIGDCYMVAAGIPEPRPDHAPALARMALEMNAPVDRIREQTGADLRIRIGIHSGPVVAGVIGQRKFAYDLWGDTVNTASRMESHGAAGEIQVSEETARLLGDAFELEERGEIDIKGKGALRTYFLRARALDAPSS